MSQVVGVADDLVPALHGLVEEVSFFRLERVEDAFHFGVGNDRCPNEWRALKTLRGGFSSFDKVLESLD